MELLLEPAISVYFRKSFNVLDKNKLSCAILSADYDDGYIAYLNGVEISRSYNFLSQEHLFHLMKLHTMIMKLLCIMEVYLIIFF